MVLWGHMGKLTTHVLDTAHGTPAANLEIRLYSLRDGVKTHVKTVRTNSDGRVNEPLLEGADLKVGVYELEFFVGAYFTGKGVRGLEPKFLEVVPVRFGVMDGAHYHVPLLVSPFGYSTYRGS